ncbi:hypothetical protein GGX14DRAFT_700466 [Mycena pura]|uniref:Uncharacterized protein n=1 Tax=Mycena pura TaxID=153505 RepID=A0AAD6Y4W9_9AGAR|nr:hypothetical protein GGX14DRAFT_700466 [Mycena pura]
MSSPSRHEPQPSKLPFGTKTKDGVHGAFTANTRLEEQISGDGSMLGLCADSGDNAIALIETFPPPKEVVLGEFPRDCFNAWTCPPPAISQYLLGPLPSIISALTLSAAPLELRPLKISSAVFILFRSTPFSYDGSFRRNTPASYLKMLDMYLYVDVTSMDPAKWYLIRMVYNRQVFGTKEIFSRHIRMVDFL